MNVVYADNFTAKDFVNLSDVQKKFWIHGAVDIASHLAASTDKEKGQCIANWYYGDKTAQRNSVIVVTMKKYGNERPSTIMIALLEHACGKIRQQKATG